MKAIWPAYSDCCPFDSALEDVYHCIKACSWLTIPVRILQCTFPSVWGPGGRVPMSRLCSDYPLLSLTRAPGVLLWKAIRVLWSCRCATVFQKAKFSVQDYLRVLHSEVLKWLAMPDLSLDHQAVRLFAGAWRAVLRTAISQSVLSRMRQARSGVTRSRNSQIVTSGKRLWTEWAGNVRWHMLSV